MKLSANTILLVAAVAMATWLIRGCFTPTRISEKLIRTEEEIKYLKKERIRDSIAWIERENYFDSADKASKERYEQLENRKQPIRNAIKNIPVIVNNYDREQLRSAISNLSNASQ